MRQTVQIIVLILLGAVFGLSALSRRYPQVGWLQAFRINRPQLSEAQKARLQRRANVFSAFQFILLGLAIPVVYVLSCVMMFNDPTTLGLVISGGIGLVLIALGIGTIWYTSRPRRQSPDRERELYKRLTGRSWDPSKTD